MIGVARRLILLTQFLVLSKEYLCTHFKFLKVGWMEYDKGQDSFSTLVQGKVQIPEGAECVRVSWSPVKGVQVVKHVIPIDNSCPS
jgi:hypothetical protein